MIDPKQFYRNFDNLLTTIRQRKTGKNFICSILTELQDTFGAALHIGNLRVYEDRGDEFVMVRPESMNGNGTIRIPTDSEVIQNVLKHGSYIYDDHHFETDTPQKTNTAPVAMVIRGPEYRWIAVFDLMEGWEREEVIFSLNAVRSAINYRLFSEAVETEMQQAAQIQKSLLPQETPKVPGYQIAARSQPTEVVGGDLYDFFEFTEDIFGLCIGDASGHGLSAALLVRDIVIGLRMGIEKHMKMVYTFQKLNDVIYGSSYSSRFASLFYAEIEKDGHLIYVNAGHPPPFVIHGESATDLKATGLILGALPEVRLHRSFARLQPNSVLVMYSDGLFERENPTTEELYKIPRLKKVVMENQEKSAQEILDAIFQDVYEFGHFSKWEDDSTLVVIKRVEESATESAVIKTESDSAKWKRPL